MRRVSPLAELRGVIVAGLLSATLLTPVAGAEAAGVAPLGDLINADLDYAAVQYTGLLARVKDDPNIPRSFRDGRVVTLPPGAWTCGFFGGALWLLYEGTGDERWKTAARDYTARIESMKDWTRDHDVGFMLMCTYGNGLRLTQDASYRDVLLQGAESLATRFSDQVGAIRSWDNNRWSFPVIIDNMMNLELLLWAADAGNRPRLREIALRHADTTLAHHFRADGSSYHLVDYDAATGAVRGRQTVQGHADGSAWARGQSWGLYGFTMMARETGKPEYLAQAIKIADFLRNHPRLPADGIPYWDFDAPGIPRTARDVSAGAIMASALVDLSTQVEPARGRAYRELAEKQVRTLSSPAFRAPLGENGNFLLMHGIGHMPEWSEIDVPLIYADYYFLEALLRLREPGRP